MEKILKFFTIIGFCFISACASEDYSSPTNDGHPIASPTPMNVSSFEKPVGNEIKIAVHKVASDEYEIRVTNISKRPVFCGYLPGQNSTYAEYFAFGVEWKAPGAKVFTTQPRGSHFSPPIVPIDPDKTVKIIYFPSEPGEYRILLGYAVDPEIERIRSTVRYEERSEELNSTMRDAFEIATSPVFDVDDNKAK